MMAKSLPCRAAGLSAVAVALACGCAMAQDQTPAAAAIAAECKVQSEIAHFELPLTNLAHRLSIGKPIRIVAIGSSSTAGFGASSPGATYPSRLEAELREHFPGHALTVVNRGVYSEELPNMIARFDTAVIAERPHLVIWQFGTNALMYDRPLSPGLVAAGVARLKSVGADVVLMDPQYAPRVLAKPARDGLIARMAQAAKESKVDLLHRYDIMRHWHEVDGLPFETFVTRDGLHLNDWGYACVAKSLGVAIAEATAHATHNVTMPGKASRLASLRHATRRAVRALRAP
jgi:acyl-CoA thioesterase-1